MFSRIFCIKTVIANDPTFPHCGFLRKNEHFLRVFTENLSGKKILEFSHFGQNTDLVDEVTDDFDSLGLFGDVVWVEFALLLYDGDGEGCWEDILSLEDEALDRLSSSYEPSLSRVSSFIDLKDSKRSRSSSP